MKLQGGSNTIRFHFGTTNPASNNIAANSKVRLIGQFYANTTDTTNGEFINGREFTVTSVGSETVSGAANYYIECSTAGMNLPDSDFSINFATGNAANIYSTTSTSTEAFFEGSDPTAVFKGADVRNQSWQPEIKAQKRPIALLLNLLFGAKIQHYL